MLAAGEGMMQCVWVRHRAFAYGAGVVIFGTRPLRDMRDTSGQQPTSLSLTGARTSRQTSRNGVKTEPEQINHPICPDNMPEKHDHQRDARITPTPGRYVCISQASPYFASASPDPSPDPSLGWINHPTQQQRIGPKSGWDFIALC